MKKDISDYFMMIGSGLIIIIIIVLICVFISIEYQNPQTYTCEIKEKWVKRKNDSDTYLVKCNNEVFKIEDLIFKGKFNSSDIYSDLIIGETYKINTTGYRIRFLSNYKNINSYEKIEKVD